MSTFHALIHKDALHDGLMQAFQVGAHTLLLIQHNHVIHLIENKCGHFGVPLDTGCVEDDTITCSVHNFRFNLATGQVIDRELENCDPIKIYPYSWRGDMLGVHLTHVPI